MNSLTKVLLILISLTGAYSASILAVTPPERAKELSAVIDKRKSIPELPNGVIEYMTLKNYLNNNLSEKVSFKDLTEAVVSGLTQALMGKGVAIRGMATLLQMIVGWMAALIPSDLVTWALGRELVVADVMLAETMIEDLFKVYAMLRN